MPKYHCFEVRLLGVEPKLWRRFLLRAGGTLWDLHQAIQVACGWSGGHLFAFLRPRGREVIAGVPDRGMGDRYPHARRVPIADVFEGEAKRTCIYQYDFGDDWRHEVALVETVSIEEDSKRRLLEGAGAFPPEDCGGEPGYERCAAATTGRGWTKEFGSEEERADLLEWLEGWAPDALDLAKLKRRFDK